MTLHAEIHPEAVDGSRKGSSVRGPAGDGVPTGASACIQCARDVLAALKVVHSEGFAHLDVIPANVIHCTRPQDSYHYRLVGFGSALQAGDSVNAEGGPRATGSPGYRAPELFGPCTASAACDVWSLGATMFELATGRLPFVFQGGSDAEWPTAIQGGAAQGGAQDVLDCLAEDQRQTFDVGLARVIAKALGKEATTRLGLRSSGISEVL